MNINDLKKECIEYLKKNNVFEYDIIDIYKILMYYLKLDSIPAVVNNINLEFTSDDVENILKLLHKFYVMKEPLQYIVGKQNFYNEEYIVNSSVLIPRSDTETLVEKAIEYIDRYKLVNMLDMCTGSGCIGISIAKNSKIKNVLMCDVSKEALNVANQNIIKNKIDRKCKTLKSNLFLSVSLKNKFDIIVSNPPYIKKEVINTLDEVVKKEPILALDGGKDGLLFYKKIIKSSLKYLTDGGYLMLEIGYDQLEEVSDIIKKYDQYNIVESVKDYLKNDRVIICRFHQK